MNGRQPDASATAAASREVLPFLAAIVTTLDFDGA
jgi:hypothetical protein